MRAFYSEAISVPPPEYKCFQMTKVEAFALLKALGLASALLILWAGLCII